ncbi:MAG: dTDP-4-dehydrorhamnose reductase [Candidatus Nezhaarchaeales archaeon]
MRILITGASGLLGSKIAELAVKLGYEVYSGYLTHEPTHGTPLKLEVRDADALRRMFDKVKPEVVIHAAALTDVDRCEMDKELAWSINVEGTRNVAELSKRYGAFLVYVSTDYVFKGDKGMYRETEEANPVNYYGLTKLEGERRVIDILDEYCIARSSVIYGSRPASGKVNFALWIIERLKRGETVNVLKDQWNSPTLNTNLAEMILEIAERKLTGVYHLAGATRVSRYEFACMIAETFDLDKELIRPVTMDKLEWIAPRPKDSSLDVSKAMKTLRKKPIRIEEALKRLREEIES